MRSLSRANPLYLLMGSTFWILTQARPLLAEPAVDAPDPGPQLTRAARQVSEQKEATPSRTEEPTGKTKEASEAEPKPSHRVGRAPRTPNATLPEGVPRAEPNARARRSVAAGPVGKPRRGNPDDPQLIALAEAERALFPEPVHGLEPGWSWDLGAAAERKPEIVSSLTPSAPKIGVLPTDQLSDADSAWLAKLNMPDLPLRMDGRVVKYLKFYRDTDQGRAIARIWVKKSGLFLNALTAAFARARLPRDLVWLSLIESGHNPVIKSPAGAAGLWQFIPSTGRMYGLTVDRWVDERLDPERSTDAAARFLADLYRRFGSWELAMAGYNMGYAGLSRAIKKFNTNDFWELSRYEAGIPWETTLYVPKILAIAIVMNNKPAFGLDQITPDEALSFDSVQVEPAQPLANLASASKVSAKEIGELNPHYLSGRTPPSGAGAAQKFTVRVPTGAGAASKRAVLPVAEKATPLYRVRFGDTLPDIAREHGVSADRLARLNQVDSGERLRVGTILLLPPPGQSEKTALEEAEVFVTSGRAFNYPGRERVFYRVLAGDMIGDVAHAFGVGETELLLWNSLDRGARLQSGMTLQVFTKDMRALKGVRYSKEGDATVLVAGTPAFYNFFEGLKGKERLVILARKGDTLASVGKRYNMSVGWMERVNRRSRRDGLAAGEQLVVYAEKAKAGDVTESPAPFGELPKVEAPHPELLPAAPAQAAKKND